MTTKARQRILSERSVEAGIPSQETRTARPPRTVTVNAMSRRSAGCLLAGS